MIEDISHGVVDTSFVLEPGDLMVLYTDGITESRRGRELFEVDRLAAGVLQHRHEPVEQIRDAVLEAVDAFGTRQDDDITLLVVRQPTAD